ncbi:MAG: hypothetical protein RMJ98_01960 [Myxococcales bacterium]|nr:hypothetical protein [Polyangiaceae bacterium]MDW8248053.1 hypothetical protein [Myxococcales bacterium]
MSASVDLEDLRTEALELLTSPWARAALERAVLHLDPSTLTWEGSHGEVCAHRLTLGLDGASLGELDEHPSALDELEAVFSRVLARRPGHGLASLATRWELEPAAEVVSYRSPERRPVHRNDPEALRRALVAYLHRRHQQAGARWVREATSLTPRRAPPELRDALAAALTRLTAP